ncbi:MAG: hypothetical protein LBL63_06480, partial [Clostridiales Family XIII bacterium]|nr:hypothetical protein [Clostridiales Family XIII bacterium]
MVIFSVAVSFGEGGFLQAALGAPAQPPTFTHNPADSTYSEEADARFYVRADSGDGGYLTYEWHRSKAYDEPQDKNVNAEDIKNDGASTFDPGSDDASLKADGTKSVLDFKTPVVDETTYYYYWVTVTNHIDSNGDGDTLDNNETNSMDSGVAEAKVVDRKLSTELQNGDFATFNNLPAFNSGQWTSNNYYVETPLSVVPGWDTTANGNSDSSKGKTLEIQVVGGSAYLYKNNPWDAQNRLGHGVNGTETAPLYFAELCCITPSSLYQEIATVPGKIYEWSLDHAATRTNNALEDVMAVVIGAAINEQDDYRGDLGTTNRYQSDVTVGNHAKGYWNGQNFGPFDYPYGENGSVDGKTTTTYFTDICMKLATSRGYDSMAGLAANKGETFIQSYNGYDYYVYICSSVRKWTHYAGTYTVPAGQGTTVFGFVTLQSAANNNGNYLDNVIFKSGTELIPEQSATYTGDSSITAPTKAGYAYALAEVRGSSVNELTGLTAFYDPDGPGAAAPAPVAPTDGLGVGGWYTTDSNTGAGGA